MNLGQLADSPLAARSQSRTGHSVVASPSYLAGGHLHLPAGFDAIGFGCTLTGDRRPVFAGLCGGLSVIFSDPDVLMQQVEDFNPHDEKDIHAVFIGGSAIPTRTRSFFDYLAEKFNDVGKKSISSV